MQWTNFHKHNFIELTVKSALIVETLDQQKYRNHSRLLYDHEKK